MHLLSTLLVLAPAIRLASAQTIDPEDVSAAARKQWCLAQQTSCPLICYQTSTGEPAKNQCDPDTLDFQCVCDDGKQPNATQYSQTIPYFLCTETNNKCVKDCEGKQSCQSDCRENNPCGAQDPPPPNTTAKASMSATPSSTKSVSSQDTIYTGLGGGSASDDKPKKDLGGRQANLNMSQLYGTAVLLVGFFAGFTILL